MNIFIEIKKGVGGLESSIFVEEFSKIYIKFLKEKSFVKIANIIKDKIGFKEIIIYTNLNMEKFLNKEKGVHRIQRVPKTESKGRIHTSTLNVNILKEKKINKIDIKKKDLKIETFKSSGAGGQHVNKTNSAVRITHIPTSIKVECQSERSQHKNKNTAMKILISKIENIKNKEINIKKKKLRNENLYISKRTNKIRTYNFIQNRITDHKTGKSFKILDKFIKGNFNILLKYFGIY
ncbi:peptide chain release factor-like protein [Candidatus Vidania fulgoroideorum]